jgi:hypothetical protein
MYAKSRKSRPLFVFAAILAIVSLLAAPTLAFAAETGFYSPSFVRVTGGKSAWVNPSYVFASDNLYTSSSAKNKGLVLQNFGIFVPGNSIIEGIIVQMEGYTGGRQVTVEISGNGGATWSSTKITSFSASKGTLFLGDELDKWGTTWTADSFSTGNFRIRLVTNNGAGTIYIDHVSVKVYYQPPNTTLIVPSVSEPYGPSTTTISATLTVTEDGSPISGKTVDFTFMGNSIGNAVTNGTGVASISGVDVSSLAAGFYDDAIYVSFAGGDGYQATFSYADFTLVGIPLTVTAHPQTKYYGHLEPTYTYEYTGTLHEGDSFAGALTREIGDNLGEYEIFQGTLTAGPGYTITYISDFLTITEAPLTVTATNYTKLITDSAITEFEFTYEGFVLGQNAAALTTQPTCELEDGADQSVPGVYEITCDGGEADNYSFNYVDGTLTVNAVNTAPNSISLDNEQVTENRLAGALVGLLTNDDPDEDEFEYSLVASGFACLDGAYPDNAFFAIDGDALETAVKFDFEAKSSYEICVQVDDGKEGVFAREFNIAVTDLPETFMSLGAQDGWVLESSETSNKGGKLNKGGKVLFVGDDASNKQYRAILSFDTSSLPEGAVITSATLRFKYAGVTGTLPFGTHGKLLVDASTVSFSKNPLLQMVDFQAAPSKKNVLSFTKTNINKWYSRTFSTINLGFINPDGMTQFRLRFAKDDNNDFGADILKIFSGNSTEANRPQLLIEYHTP